MTSFHTSSIATIARELHEDPPWLLEHERISLTAYQPSDDLDTFAVLRMELSSPRNEWRDGLRSEVRVGGRAWRSITYRQQKGAAVDLIVRLLREAAEQLECHAADLTEDLVPLACSALNDEGALVVWRDALLERGVLRGDDRTEDKMSKAARACAQHVVASLIFGKWSTYQWPVVRRASAFYVGLDAWIPRA